jgi:hypothetical protein
VGAPEIKRVRTELKLRSNITVQKTDSRRHIEYE